MKNLFGHNRRLYHLSLYTCIDLAPYFDLVPKRRKRQTHVCQKARMVWFHGRIGGGYQRSADQLFASTKASELKLSASS